MPCNLPSQGEWNPVRITQAVQDLAAGRSNAHGDFSLNVSPATSTTVAAPNCGINSTPSYVPTNLAASAEIAAGTMFVSSVGRGFFVLTHSASASARTYRYALQG